jgi:hypothetical protein
MQRLLLINSVPEVLDHARTVAYPGRESAEVNSALREVRRLLDLDAIRRSVPPITLPRLRARAR